MQRVLQGNISAGMTLAQPIYGINGQVIINSGVELSAFHISKIAQLDVKYIYVQGEAQLIDENDTVAQNAKSEFVLASHLSLDEIRVGKYVQIEHIKGRVMTLLDECCMHKELQPLFTVMQNCNDYLFKHAVCGYFFAMMIGIGCGIEGMRLRDLGLGALLRDVGMITISRDILNKPGTLTPEEMAIVKQHTEKGHEILHRNSEISLAAANCALQHHERFDGSGYPRGAKGDNIHEFAQITALADVYSSMTANTPYRKALSVYDALAIIEKAGAAYFNPKLIRVLVSNVAIYPLGAIVRLNNQVVGIVNDYADELRTKPILKITKNEAGERVNQTVTIDMEANPTIYIADVS
ncbi:HD-GYP domain-containing protein [Sporomusa sp. KB1]|uniref:HD-GYP domain-containing protein n=1 Tax=Sporomusa sp. KB1 TaxID=943346 RepID=UPI0011AC351D|nr:HD-GYP domain-containing protein [Sporomusa sp. KB1]TWH47011.1 HD-GYP domain-containing protein (c-di-GMP phosphodiesterase class II) [Sporomusa sp. KB1]